MQAGVTPPSGDELTRNPARHNDGMAAGKANLTAMCVPAELELESRGGSLLESFRTMRKEYRTVAVRNSFPGFGEVVGFVKMGIVDPCDPKSLPIPLNEGRLVEQDRKAEFFKLGNHFEKVMVSENSKALRRERAAYPLQLPQAGAVIAVQAVSEIPGDHRRIVGRAVNEFFNHGRQGRVEVAMEVAELQETEPLEGAWELRKFPFLAHELDIEKPPPQGALKTEDPQNPGNGGIERNNTLQAKDSFALMEELRALPGLLGEALFEKR